MIKLRDLKQQDFEDVVIHQRCFSQWTSGLVFVLTEVVSQLPAADLLRFLSQLQCMLGDLIAGHIGCHDEDGVLTLDGLPLPVSEAPLNVRAV